MRKATSNRRRRAGFTLIEVLVALTVMAVLAGMAWRGVDALVRTRAGAQASTDRTLALATGMAQFEYDLSMLTDTAALAPLSFDGSSLRLTRRAPQGVQLVAWTLQDGRWQRWASAPAIREADLQDAWLRSQQWSAIRAEAVAVLGGIDGWQVYLYRGNGWSNAQSSGDVQSVPVVDAPVTPTPAPTSTPLPASSPASGAAPGALAIPRFVNLPPTGIRIVLATADGEITREKALPPGGGGAAGP